ncbi:HAD-like hydrolase superfamily protein [Pleurotus pulmonarius]
MDEVQAYIFDVFGTLVDWRTAIIKALQSEGRRCGASSQTDWEAFANEWRQGYMRKTREIANGLVDGPLNVDIMHRNILEEMLASTWHFLDGWADSSEGLHALKQTKIIAALSNGNVRLLVDMAKHANLPWDAVLSCELLGSFKPNPKTYLGAAYHLSLPPQQVAMVAAHIYDLRAAASHGMKTVYVRRGEDIVDDVKSKDDGGEVDVVVNSIIELAALINRV